MKKVKNYEEISKLIFKNLKKGVKTNTFMSKEDFENEINHGKLYYFEIDNGLLIFRDRGDYYILNYYLQDIDIDEIKSFFETSIDKIVIVEIVTKKEEAENTEKIVGVFKQLGMEIAVERERFVKKAKDVKKDVSNVENSEINIKLCEKGDKNKIITLFRENFDKYYGCIPNDEKLEIDIQKGKIYKAIIGEEIVGLLHFNETSSNLEIRHLAVAEKYRKLGVASKLIDSYEEKNDKNKVVWTGKPNFVAQRLYIKKGYEKDEYVSIVLKKVYKK